MPKELIFFLSFFFCTLHFAQSKDSGLTFRPYPPVYRTSMALSVRLTSWSRSHDARAAARKNLASPLRRWTRGRTRGHDTYQAGEREADIFLRACATKTEEKKKKRRSAALPSAADWFVQNVFMARLPFAPTLAILTTPTPYSVIHGQQGLTYSRWPTYGTYAGVASEIFLAFGCRSVYGYRQEV